MGILSSPRSRQLYPSKNWKPHLFDISPDHELCNTSSASISDIGDDFEDFKLGLLFLTLEQ